MGSTRSEWLGDIGPERQPAKTIRIRRPATSDGTSIDLGNGTRVTIKRGVPTEVARDVAKQFRGSRIQEAAPEIRAFQETLRRRVATRGAPQEMRDLFVRETKKMLEGFCWAAWPYVTGGLAGVFILGGLCRSPFMLVPGLIFALLGYFGKDVAKWCDAKEQAAKARKAAKAQASIEAEAAKRSGQATPAA